MAGIAALLMVKEVSTFINLLITFINSENIEKIQNHLMVFLSY